jgi:hypothetical protein
MRKQRFLLNGGGQLRLRIEKVGVPVVSEFIIGVVECGAEEFSGHR